MIKLMLSFSSKRESNLPLNTLSFALTISMPSIFLEKDGDTIYEELEEDNLEEAEDEYREDKLDQMISKYSYWFHEHY